MGWGDNMSNQQIIDEGKKYVMNTYGRLPVAMVKGEGAYIWDADGKEYLDFVSGIAVNCLGHAHPKVVAAVAKQAETMFHCSNLYWIEPQVQLAKLLVENSVFDKVFFGNSGAESNEGAIKLARKYAKIHMGEDKYEIITMNKSFHGRTLATLTATGQEKFHQGFAPLPQGFKYAPYNDLEALKEVIGPNTCAIMMEPIQGEGGVNVPDQDYMDGVKELCEKHNLLLIFDEVQTGVGRTGKLFGYEHFGVEPHIMTLAKALGGGAPIGALLAKEEVANAFQPGDHASTFGGNPLVTAAGVATLSTLLEEGIVENAAQLGTYFMDKLAALKDKFDFIKEVRGKGLIIGIELEKEVGPIVAACQEMGLLVIGAGPSVLRFLPPLNITTEHIDKVMDIIEQALSQ